jgi:hypothetical protein
MRAASMVVLKDALTVDKMAERRVSLTVERRVALRFKMKVTLRVDKVVA